MVLASVDEFFLFCAKFLMIAALVAVPESSGGSLLGTPLSDALAKREAVSALCFSYCSSPRLYLRSLTVKFLGELQIRSNYVSTSFICLMSSLVLGDWRNFTVLMKADLYWLPSI